MALRLPELAEKAIFPFITTIAGFNIHLDAQLANLSATKNFYFFSLFGIPVAS